MKSIFVLKTNRSIVCFRKKFEMLKNVENQKIKYRKKFYFSGNFLKFLGFTRGDYITTIKILR